jgi:CRISPR/Cas system CSM-associated protein Csm3 (group 7 of RAMP superfamily)
MQEGLTMKNTHRYLARFIIEAETPLAVGSGERDVMTDRLVATDVNGLPFIPGTALAGVLRNAVREVDKDDFFGFQKGNDGQGSRIILSAAQLIGKDGKAIDGLQTINFNDAFYAHFQNLPIRQHVRISHKGAAEQGGKFDEQVVYKGTRFCFEMELVGNKKDEESWKQLLAEFSNPAFRIGGGTRKGFGAIKVVEVKSEILDLSNNQKLNLHLEKTSELNDRFWDNIQSPQSYKPPQSSNWIQYELTLTPDDFFLFGSGFGSEDGSADMSYVTEKVIQWENGKPSFTDEKVLIPATSVKGALAHRTAFHFNRNLKIYSDTLMLDGKLEILLKEGFKIPETIKKFDSNIFEHRARMASEGNPAVRALFGYSANDDDGQRGNVIFSDVFVKHTPEKKKLLNHVAIDRFTRGAMDGALFSEEVVGSKEQFTLKILVKKEKEEDKQESFASYLKAFECALNDLCTGMLPLGGGTMRGHGCFSGEMKKENTDYESECK